MTEKQAQTIEWSPDLWIRDTATQDYLQQNSKTKLSFKDIIHIVNKTLSAADDEINSTTNPQRKEALINQKRTTVNACARFITLGKEYERNPTEARQRAMQEADAVLHSTHQQLIQMLNSKELVTVNPQKVSILVFEIFESVRQNKTEDLKSDPSPFGQAVAALLEVIVTIAKEYIFRPAIQLEVLRQVEVMSTLTTEITEIYQQKSWDANSSKLLLKTQQFWDGLRALLFQVNSALKEAS